VDAAAVEPWLQIIRKLAFDQAFYEAALAKVNAAAVECSAAGCSSITRAFSRAYWLPASKQEYAPASGVLNRACICIR
jgi:hypothetical protein